MKETLSSRKDKLSTTFTKKDKDLNTTNNTFRMDSKSSYDQPQFEPRTHLHGFRGIKAKYL